MSAFNIQKKKKDSYIEHCKDTEDEVQLGMPRITPKTPLPEFPVIFNSSIIPGLNFIP